MANSSFLLQSPTRFSARDLDFGDSVVVPEGFYLDAFFVLADEPAEDHARLVKIRLRERLLNKPAVTLEKESANHEAKFEIGGDSEEEETSPQKQEQKELNLNSGVPEPSEAITKQSKISKTDEVPPQISEESEPKQEKEDEIVLEDSKTGTNDHVKPPQTQTLVEEIPKVVIEEKDESPVSPDIYPPELVEKPQETSHHSDDELDEEVEEEGDEDIEDYLKNLEKNAKTN